MHQTGLSLGLDYINVEIFVEGAFLVYLIDLTTGNSIAAFILVRNDVTLRMPTHPNVHNLLRRSKFVLVEKRRSTSLPNERHAKIPFPFVSNAVENYSIVDMLVKRCAT